MAYENNYYNEMFENPKYLNLVVIKKNIIKFSRKKYFNKSKVMAILLLHLLLFFFG
jgi:hypothetical protein